MKRNYLLALLSAFILWLAWPPIPFTAPLLLIGFVPLLLAVETIIESGAKKKGRKIFWLSLTAFFIWNTSCIYWVFNSLNAVMPAVYISVLISLIPFGLAALLMSFVFWFYYRLRRVTSPLWSYVGLICFWIGYEYLHQSWDLAFPWMTLGNGFAEMHQLAQWYEYTGVYGGTLWIWLCNILIFELYKSIKSATVNRNKLIIATILVITLPIAGSLAIYNTYVEKSNPANVVVVQPNIDPYAKWNSPTFRQVEQLIRLSQSVAQPNTEYFIWPETSIPELTNEEKIRSNVNYMQTQGFLSKYKNGNVISGMESYLLYDNAKTPTATLQKQLDNKYFDYFNAAIQIENSPKVQFYHKSKLVPGVEQLPFATALAFMKPIFASFGGSSGGFGKQDEPSVFYSQSGIGVSPVICYESIWGEWIAKSVKKGSQFIVIITNDGWWGNTSGKDQHFEYAKLRAIETRRWVARSANTGIS
ncbi:MAG TPA: apolipoprotein N-acyltransferase, partial [Sphingobacteriaceae bacterium]|nr:apolipoprotein N-acyltransferase [Sphingobacteriaceae bacterium]